MFLVIFGCYGILNTFYDGIHPTPNGYKAMYEQVLKDLPEIFKEDHLSMSYQNS